MRYYRIIDGNKEFFSGILEAGNKIIINPTREQIIAEGWIEYEIPQIATYSPSYDERVELLIRERYSLSQELAIQRQRDTKVEEFNEYFSYCEECKTRAKYGD